MATSQPKTLPRAAGVRLSAKRAEARRMAYELPTEAEFRKFSAQLRGETLQELWMFHEFRALLTAYGCLTQPKLKGNMHRASQSIMQAGIARDKQKSFTQQSPAINYIHNTFNSLNGEQLASAMGKGKATVVVNPPAKAAIVRQRTEKSIVRELHRPAAIVEYEQADVQAMEAELDVRDSEMSDSYVDSDNRIIGAGEGSEDE